MGGGVSLKPQPEEAAGTWFIKYGSNLKQPVTAPERPSSKNRDSTRLLDVPYEADKEKWADAADNVNRPSHYTQGGIEAIDAIESALGEAGFRAYCKGNALKYIWREEHKGGTESLRKAIWYLDRLVNGR